MSGPDISNPELYRWWARLEKLWGGEIPEHLHEEARKSYALDDTPEEALGVLRGLLGDDE